MGICLKGDIIARLGIEPAYYDVIVQHFSYYATRTPLAKNLRILGVNFFSLEQHLELKEVYKAKVPRE